MEILKSIISAANYLVGMVIGLALLVFAVGVFIVEVPEASFQVKAGLAVPAAVLGLGLIFWAKRNKREGTNQIRGEV